jgi:hypothetical protein
MSYLRHWSSGEAAVDDTEQRVFLSYHHTDSEISRKVAVRMQQLGFQCWRYEDNSLPGISYLKQAGSAIEACLAVVLLISRASCKSGQVTKEIIRAHEEHKPIFPILLDLDHRSFQRLQPEWREALGSYASIEYSRHSTWSLCGLIAKALNIIVEASKLDGIEEANGHAVASETPIISGSLCQSFQVLSHAIDALTAEQLRAINMLRSSKRARISGCAGSGKTLVAADKAIKLDNAGLRVLFLCHSPILVKYVAALLHGSTVEAADFTGWLSKYLPPQLSQDSSVWHYNFEPSAEQIDTAFDGISSSKEKYDAIVVDEAQDFRPEWWLLVEEALTHTDAILYVFHDDRQQLSRNYIPQYPIDRPHVDLSRNIRNSGSVYKVIKYYNRYAPMGEKDLSGLGNSVVLDLPFPKLEICLQVALNHVADAYSLESDIIIVVPESEPIAELREELGQGLILRGIWQDAVYRSLLTAIREHLGDDASVLNGWVRRLRQICYTFSAQDKPSVADVSKVNRFVKELPIRAGKPRYVRWRALNFSLGLASTSGGQLGTPDVLGYFARPDWHKDLTRYQFGTVSPDRCVFHTPGQAKGLEADAIIMMVRNSRSFSETEYYVAISRARHGVFFVTMGDDQVLPAGLRENLMTLEDYTLF